MLVPLPDVPETSSPLTPEERDKLSALCVEVLEEYGLHRPEELLPLVATDIRTRDRIFRHIVPEDERERIVDTMFSPLSVVFAWIEAEQGNLDQP